MVRRCGSDEGSHADEKKGITANRLVSNKIFMLAVVYFYMNVLV